MAGRCGSAALLPHRDLVPQEDEVSVRVAKLGAVAPEALPRRGDERHACGHEPAVRLFHVVDLEGEDDPVGGDVTGGLVEEQREAPVVLQATVRRPGTSNSSFRPRWPMYQARAASRSRTRIVRWSSLVMVGPLPWLARRP